MFICLLPKSSLFAVVTRTKNQASTINKSQKNQILRKEPKTTTTYHRRLRADSECGGAGPRVVGRHRRVQRVRVAHGREVALLVLPPPQSHPFAAARQRERRLGVRRGRDLLPCVWLLEPQLAPSSVRVRAVRRRRSGPPRPGPRSGGDGNAGQCCKAHCGKPLKATTKISR